MISKHFNLNGLPPRPPKPRSRGLTLLLDKGLALRQVEDVLSVAAEYVDAAKLGWGTAVVTPALEAKVTLYREAEVPVYFGGTLFEAFYLRGRFEDYRRLLHRLNLRHVEVSDGSVNMPHEEKLDCIRRLAPHFTVLSEVGSKDRGADATLSDWVEQIQLELDAGSWKVICEARESGTAGLCRPDGRVRTDLVDQIVDGVPSRDVIFEAPQKAQQVWFLKRIGPEVNLGNIAPSELVPLETLRLGLRGDTLLDFYSPGDEEASPLLPSPPRGAGNV